MTSIDQALRARALHGYEIGRVRFGLRALWMLAPVLALSFAFNASWLVTALIGVLLFVLACGLRYRGGIAGRAATAGLIASAAPLALRAIGHCCAGDACMSWCMAGCVAGGGLAGIGIGLAAIAEREGRWTFLLTATLISGLAGVLGCAVAGLAGIAGMALATAASSLPICWVLQPSRSA
jgi:hypothetical protein